MIQGKKVPKETIELIKENTGEEDWMIACLKHGVKISSFLIVTRQTNPRPIPNTDNGAKLINCIRELNRIAEAKK